MWRRYFSFFGFCVFRCIEIVKRTQSSDPSRRNPPANHFNNSHILTGVKLISKIVAMKINLEIIIKILKFLKKIGIEFWRKVLLKAFEFVRCLITKRSTSQFKFQKDAPESESAVNTMAIETNGNRNVVGDTASETTTVIAVEIIADKDDHEEMNQQNLNVSSIHASPNSGNMIRNENKHGCASVCEEAKEGDENSYDELMNVNVNVNVNVDVDNDNVSQLPAPILFESISENTSETHSIVTDENNESKDSLKNTSAFPTENNFENNLENDFEKASSSNASSPNASAISSKTTVSQTSNVIPNVSLSQAGNSCSNGITVRHQVSLSDHSLSPPTSLSSSELSNVAMDKTVEPIAINETVKKNKKMELNRTKIDNAAEELKYCKTVSSCLGEKLKNESNDSEQHGKEEASECSRNEKEKKDDYMIIKNKGMERHPTSKSIHLNHLHLENGSNSKKKVNCSDSSTQNEHYNYSIPIDHSSSIKNQPHYSPDNTNNTNNTHSNHRKHPNHPRSNHGFNSQQLQSNRVMRTQRNSHGYHHPSPPTPHNRFNPNASSYNPNHLRNATNQFTPFNNTNPPLSTPLHPPNRFGQVMPLFNPNRPIQNDQNYPTLSNPILSNPILSNPILSNPILSNPILSNPILPSPIQNVPSIQKYTSNQKVSNGHYKKRNNGVDRRNSPHFQSHKKN